MIEPAPSPSPATVLGVAAAAAIPAATLPLLAGVGRHSPGSLPSPFADASLLAAQCVAALPMGLIAASMLRGKRPGVAAWAGFGLALLAALWLLGPALATGLDSAGAGFPARAIVRASLATALVVPWLVVVNRRAAGDDARGGRRLAVVAALLLAVLPPMALAHRLIRSRTSDFHSHRSTGRLARAWAALDAMHELGAEEAAAGEPIHAARIALARDLRGLGRWASRGPAGEIPAAERVRRAFALIGLDRLDEAESVLRPMLAAAEPDATLLLAAVERDRGRWAEAEYAYLRVLDRQLPSAPRDPAAMDRCVTAYDGLVDARIGAGRTVDAGIALRQAIVRLPPRAGHFTLRLGTYEIDAGRPAIALARLSEVAGLDPSLAHEARALIRSVRVRTPACLLAR